MEMLLRQSAGEFGCLNFPFRNGVQRGKEGFSRFYSVNGLFNARFTYRYASAGKGGSKNVTERSLFLKIISPAVKSGGLSTEQDALRNRTGESFPPFRSVFRASAWKYRRSGCYLPQVFRRSSGLTYIPSPSLTSKAS